MKTKLIISFILLATLNSSTTVLANNYVEDGSFQNLVEHQPSNFYNELDNSVILENNAIELPDNFISDISFIENNIVDASSVNIHKSIDEISSSRMYYYEFQKVSTLATQKNVFIKKHPMNYWTMIPKERPFFDIGTLKTVSISAGTAYNWNSGASINLGVSVNNSQSVSAPVRAYANKMCTIGIFSDVVPTRYYQIKRVKGNGQIISKTPVTIYTPLNTKYNGVYQYQVVKGINGKNISINK